MSEMCHGDAAYVLGALAPADRRDYEEHLRSCATCQESVQRIAGVPGLLALVDITAVDAEEPAPPPTLLPILLERTHVARRRQGRLVGGLLAAAVAAVLVLGTVLVVRSPSNPTTAGAAGSAAPAPVAVDQAAAMSQVLPGPMTASLELVDKKWGTAITVICQYDTAVDPSVAYDLTIIDRDGSADPAGTWLAVPGVTARVPLATAIKRDRIAALEVRLPDGRTILRSAL